MRKKIAFVLGGGGVLGAHEVGMLQALSEAGIRPDIIVGTSVGAINGAISGLWTQGLPDDYYQQYTKAVAAISRDDVLRVAKKYIDMDKLAIVIVGDKASIEAPLKAANVAPIAYLDIDGRKQ